MLALWAFTVGQRRVGFSLIARRASLCQKISSPLDSWDIAAASVNDSDTSLSGKLFNACTNWGPLLAQEGGRLGRKATGWEGWPSDVDG